MAIKCKVKVLVSWSSGKDSAWTLYHLQKQQDIEIVGLLTTINKAYDRVSIHGVRRSVLERQAVSCGLPLWKIMLPNACSHEKYERIMEKETARIKEWGITHIAFGDLFLENVRNYRISRLVGSGITPLFPLWLQPTAALANQMIEQGLRARIVSVDPKQLDPSFLGCEYDKSLLKDLPEAVDPCGENGEFHTCVYDGPMFSHPVPIQSGVSVERNNFYYQDLLSTHRE